MPLAKIDAYEVDIFLRLGGKSIGSDYWKILWYSEFTKLTETPKKIDCYYILIENFRKFPKYKFSKKLKFIPKND